MLVINLNKNIDKLINDIENYKDFAYKIDLMKCTDYRLYDTELLIYNNSKLIYACSYEDYHNKKYITKVYFNNGDNTSDLIYTYDIKY